MKFFVLMALTLLVACKEEIGGRIKVTQAGQFNVRASNGEKFALPVGEMNGELVVDSKPEKSYLKLYLRKNNKKFRPEIPVRLPNIDVLLGANDPVRLEAKGLGQDFGIMVMREIRHGKDRFTMTFHDSEFSSSFAEMTFEYEPSTVLYDEKKMEFLASYQKVKRKQRALIVRIDGGVDDMMSLVKGFGWLETTLDHIVNFGGAVLISPWAYARYANVQWIIGDDSVDDKDLNKWKEVTKAHPVIDYFAFVHDGDQDLPKNASKEDVGLKKNQLRAVYTGACNSKNGDEWIQDYGSVVGAGQNRISASPLFQFGVLRRWVYGYSFENSLIKAYQAGVRRVRALEWVTFAKYWQEKTGVLLWDNVDDMLESSEILYSYTAEIPATNVEISQSAILTKTGEKMEIVKKGVVEKIAEKNGEMVVH